MTDLDDLMRKMVELKGRCSFDFHGDSQAWEIQAWIPDGTEIVHSSGSSLEDACRRALEQL